MQQNEGQPDLAHGGPGDEELARGKAGRHDAVLSRRHLDGGSGYVVHVRPAPSPRNMSLRFREGHALAVMGFRPRPRCLFFPLGCAVAGCYYAELRDVGAGDDDSALAIFQRLCAELEAAIDQVVEGIAVAAGLGLAVRLA